MLLRHALPVRHKQRSRGSPDESNSNKNDYCSPDPAGIDLSCESGHGSNWVYDNNECNDTYDDDTINSDKGNAVVSPGCVFGTGQMVRDRLLHCLNLSADLYKERFSASKPSKRRDSDNVFFVPNKNHTSRTRTESFEQHSVEELLQEPPPLLRRGGDNRSGGGIHFPMAIIPTKNEALHLHDPLVSTRTVRNDHSRRPRGAYDLEADGKLDSSSSSSPLDELLPQQQLQHPDNNNNNNDDIPPEFSLTNRSNQAPHLREIRLSLFQEHQRGSLNATAVKYSRALEDMAVQDQSIRLLQTQLSASQNELQQLQTELQLAVAQSAQQQQQATAQSRGSAKEDFEDQIAVHAQLREELVLNGKLTNRIAELEKERDRLRVDLEYGGGPSVEIRAWTPERHSKTYPESPVRTTTTTTPRSTSEKSSSGGFSPYRFTNEVLALRTELVEVRANLAEARAARLSAEHTVAVLAEEKEARQMEARRLRSKLELFEKALEDAKQRVVLSEESGGKERSRLRAEMEKKRLRVEQSLSELSENSKKNKKLEDSLAEAQAEVGMLQSQLGNSLKQLEITRKEADERLKVSEDNSKYFQEEVRRITERLSRTDTDIIQQAAEHIEEKQRLTEDLLQSRQVTENLRFRLMQMDDQVALAERREEGRRELISAEVNNMKGLSQSGFRKMSGGVFQLLRNKLDSIEI
jgi:hypothetical protein